MGEYTTISIPKDLADRIKKRLETSSFRSLSEYTIYILRQIEIAAEMREKSKGFTKEDEKEIERRLKALGYI